MVHFEIIGKDPAKLRRYFGELFGWEFDTSSLVAEAVSEPANYGFVNRVTTADGTGIPGGVGGGAGYESHILPTSASRMSRPPCGRRKASAASAGWVRSGRRQGWWSATSPTPKAT